MQGTCLNLFRRVLRWVLQKKENVFKCRCSGGRRVHPLAAYEEKLPIEDRNFFVDRGALETMTSSAIAVNEVFFNYVAIQLEGVSAVQVF